MLNWLKHNDYPEFWNNYIKTFKTKAKVDLNTARFVVFDTETTGLDPNNDRILSIGAVSIIGNTIDIADSFEIYLKQELFNADTVEIHGILKSGTIEKVEEPEAIKQFLDYLKDAVLVAHHTAFDVTMINQCLKRINLPKLKNKTLDTGHLFKKTNKCKNADKHYGLDELTDIFNIKKHDRHTASGDAYITGLLFLKILSTLKKERHTTLNSLFINKNKRGLL